MRDLQAQPAPVPTQEDPLLHSREVDSTLLAQALGGEASGPRWHLAARILRAAGSWQRLGYLDRQELECLGLSDEAILQLQAGIEVGRRLTIAELSGRRPCIETLDRVVAWARPRLVRLEHEEVWLLSLDGQNGLIATFKIARGGLHGCALLPRDVLRPAIRSGASAIVVVHNHPSGDPRPSPDDVSMTHALVDACDVVGVPLVDHVIVARGGSASLLEMGIIS